MDRYFKHYGYIKLLDWEQFLQHPIYAGVYFIRICRCWESERKASILFWYTGSSSSPTWVVLPLKLPLLRDKEPSWETAYPQLFWIKSSSEGSCRSHLRITFSNIKTAQRSAESILHPCECATASPKPLWPSTHQKILTHFCLNTRLPSPPALISSQGEHIECWHGVQSQPDGCECINTEWYPGMLSVAWYVALERKGMHGHAPSHCTFTTWKPKRDLKVIGQKFHKPEKPVCPLSVPIQQQGLQLHQNCGDREARLVLLLPANRPGLQVILPTARA